MRFSSVYRIVFRKELRELLRDRRSLFWLFAPPIILPGLAICAGLFIGTQALRIASDGFPVIIENPQAAPDLVARFEQEKGIQVIEPPPPDSPDIYGDAIAIVSVPADFQAQLTSEEAAFVRILTKDNSLITILGKGAVRGVIDQYSQDLLDQRLAEEGLTRNWLKPIQIGEARRSAERDTGSSAGDGVEEEGQGTSILATIFLPLAVTSWLLGGGMGLVLDTTVGEKERQTIENLLVTPASRVGIVAGKMSVVFIASMLVMTLWLGEGILLNAFSTAGPEIAELDQAQSGEVLDILLDNSRGILGLVGMLVLMVVPFTIMLNGLMMAWCAYAANYREANLVMALLQLGLPASVLLTIFSFPPEVVDWVYAVPFFGTIVAIRDLFSDTLTTSGLIVNILGSLTYAGMGIGLAAWMFEREWSLTRGLQ